MRRLSVSAAFIVVIMASCNSESHKDKVKDGKATVAQVVKNDTLVTIYSGVSPCRGCKQINTEIRFVRSLEDTVGRFNLKEDYINKKDLAFQHYEGVGNYKVMPTSNGDVKGVAFYNMVLDDETRNYLYLLEDSVTLVRVDEKGRPLAGDQAAVLRRMN